MQQGGMKGNMVKCKFLQNMQSSTLAVFEMDFFMTLQLNASIHSLKSQRSSEASEASSENKKIFLLYDWCFTGSLIPLSKTLLTQTISNYQNYSHKHYKLTLNRIFYQTRISKREPHKRRICLKYSSLWCKNYKSLNYSLTKSSFYISVFNEKICRIKALDACPT